MMWEDKINHSLTSHRENIFNCRLPLDSGPFSLLGLAFGNPLRFKTSSESGKDLLFLTIYFTFTSYHVHTHIGRSGVVLCNVSSSHVSIIFGQILKDY